MAGHGSKRPDSILADYFDELLSSSDESPWAEDAEPARDEQARRSDSSPSQRQTHARVGQSRSRPIAEAEKPALSPGVLSPAIRSLEQVTPSEPEPEPEPAPAPVSAGRSEPETVDETQKGRWRNGRPPWAQQGFECLIFRVAGLQLAVPLVLLGQVHRLERELTPLVGRPDWFLGLLRIGDRTIRVADTARWVMPERYRDDFRQGYRFVIQLGDSAWGLACDEVAQSFLVQPDEVKWRSEGGRRQWLAGTIRKEMCALLDVSQMAALLQKAETERNPDLDR